MVPMAMSAQAFAVIGGAIAISVGLMIYGLRREAEMDSDEQDARKPQPPTRSG